MSNYKDIPHPNWDNLLDNWLSHIPLNLRPTDVDLEALLRLSGPKFEDKMQVALVEGIRERTFVDALFLRDKALYCIRICSTLNRAGHPTWSALAMYDACFFAAKSLIYLLGFRDVGTDSKFYLALFHQETKKGPKYSMAT